jgi:Zn finger protein HypA/HybF involved in hydrogenase expression
MKKFFNSSSTSKNIWRNQLYDIKCKNCNQMFKADTIKAIRCTPCEQEMFNIYMEMGE